MVSSTNIETVKALTTNGIDIAAFGGLGHLCGRYVNHLIKHGSIPSFIGKLEIADLKSAAVCCALFITIDRFVQGILTSFFGDPRKPKEIEISSTVLLSDMFGRRESGYKFTFPQPNETSLIYSVIRITIDTVAAVTLFNLAAPHLNMASIEINTAAAVISTAIVVYGLGHFVINSFNNRP